MRALLPLLALAAGLPGEEGWWMREPIRWVQTNLRETDSGLDARRLVDFLTGFRANVLLLNMGGIVAQYPTRVPFHYPSRYIPPGRDPFGEVLKLAHARGIRVVGRFDFSKTPRAVFDAHPEWFFRQVNGEPVIYNELYSTCINGGYYREHALKILAEALETYDVDGLFFNMFGNQSSDYSGRFVGHCHCEACRRKYRQLYNRDLPAQPDEQYRQFMFVSSREVAAEIGQLIRSRRPRAGYFNYLQEYTDGIMSESNTSLRRPLPFWPYASSDNVNRARTSQPGKMAVNLCMQFVDYPWRFATVPGQEISLRLWQNVAHGGALAFSINGTPEVQQDQQAIDAARPVFRWLAGHEQYYAGQVNAARVLLLGAPQRGGRTYSQTAYRGLFRFLTEEHIPFAAADNLDWLGRREFDLVISGDWAPRELEDYVREGGRLLLATPRAPEFGLAPVVKKWTGVESYLRVRERAWLPSLAGVNLLLLQGEFTEVDAPGEPVLTFVPPSMFGPPEKVHVDMTDTRKPGLVLREFGKGKVAWLPWDAGSLYYRLSLPAHAHLLKDLVDHLLARGRQLKTDAHPLVEMTLMRQRSRLLLHLVNVSGHSGTAYHPPLTVNDIRVEVAGEYPRALAIRNPLRLPTARAGGYTAFTVPRLTDYELIVLE